MKAKILALGIVIIIVGALFALMPGALGQVEAGLGLAPGPTRSQYLVKIAPENYSYLSYSMGPSAELSVAISAGPQSVDFFLMNEGNFSSWVQAATGYVQVYPQSAFNVKNYSFDISGTGRAQTYYLVFASGPNSSQTNVLVRYSLQDAAFSSGTTVPEVFFGVGVVVALIGVRAGGKRGETEVSRRGGTPSLTDAGGARCRFCGAQLNGDSKFCLSCGKSQG